MPKKKAAKPLTDKEEIFAYEYIKDLNATAAARRAGYTMTSKMAGTRVLERPPVKALVKQLIEERKASCRFSAERVIEELGAIAAADINSYITIEQVEVVKLDRGKNGKGKGKTTKVVEERVRIRPLHHLDTRPIQLIKDGNDGISFKMNDKIKALELLGRHLDLFKDNASKGAVEELGRLLVDGMNNRLKKK